LVWGENAMKNSSVFEWHRQFREGWEDVQDYPRSGQPKMQRTDANLDRIWTLVSPDRRLGVTLIAEEANMNRETVQQIMMDDLGTRQISARIVPQILSDNQKCQLPGQETYYKHWTIHLICLT
jgi:hypothetical protein